MTENGYTDQQNTITAWLYDHKGSPGQETEPGREFRKSPQSRVNLCKATRMLAHYVPFSSNTNLGSQRHKNIIPQRERIELRLNRPGIGIRHRNSPDQSTQPGTAYEVDEQARHMQKSQERCHHEYQDRNGIGFRHTWQALRRTPNFSPRFYKRPGSLERSLQKSPDNRKTSRESRRELITCRQLFGNRGGNNRIIEAQQKTND